MSQDQNVGHSHNIKINNNSFKSMEQFKYLEKTLMNQNPIQEEIKIKWKLGNACCYWCRIFCLLFCYPKIKEINVHRTIILPVVLYGYEIW